VLQQLREVQRNDQRGLSQAALSRRLRADPLQLEPLLELLAELDWVSRLDEPGDARYVLLCDPERTALAPLLQRTLLAPGAASARVIAASGLPDMTLLQALG
jgi:membrane protein